MPEAAQNSPCTHAGMPEPVQNSPCTAKIAHFDPFSACRANIVTLQPETTEAGRLVLHRHRRVPVTELVLLIATICSDHGKLTLALTRRSFPPCHVTIRILRKKYRPCSLKMSKIQHFSACRGEEYFTARPHPSRRGGFSFISIPLPHRLVTTGPARLHQRPSGTKLAQHAQNTPKTAFFRQHGEFCLGLTQNPRLLGEFYLAQKLRTQAPTEVPRVSRAYC